MFGSLLAKLGFKTGTKVATKTAVKTGAAIGTEVAAKTVSKLGLKSGIAIGAAGLYAFSSFFTGKNREGGIQGFLSDLSFDLGLDSIVETVNSLVPVAIVVGVLVVGYLIVKNVFWSR